MREEKGGVYGVRSDVDIARIPENAYTIRIDFGCAPENVDDLIATALKDIETLKKEGASDKNLQKTKETHRRERETDLRDNEWWMRTLEKSYMYKGKAPENMDKYLELVDKLTIKDIQETAKKYFLNEKYVQVVMNPVK
jgi:zinc protease